MKSRNSTRFLFLLAIPLMLSSCLDFAKVIRVNEKQFHRENQESHRYVDFMGGKIHYVVKHSQTAKEVLVFSHGSPGSWDAYAHLMNDTLLSKQFTMISYDRPGFGQTKPKKPRIRLSDQAAVIKRILDSEQIDNPVYLVGHSYGGPVVLRFANDYPNQTAGLALIASPVEPALEKPFWYNRFADSRLIRWMIPKSMRYSNDEIMPLGQELSQLETIWNQTALRISIVHGKKDKLVPFEHTHFLESHLKENIFYTNYAEEDDHFVLWTDIPKIRESILALLP